MSGLTGARCVGQWSLFDSTELSDHEQARDLCAGCPALTACAILLNDVQTASSHFVKVGGGPRGTWAGKLFGRRGVRRAESRTLPREHGTDRGYYQHRSNGTTACAACRAAHAQANRKASA